MNGLGSSQFSNSHIAGRVARRVLAFLERMRFRVGLPEPDPPQAQLSQAFRHPIQAGTREGLASLYLDLFPDSVEVELLEAGQLVQHQFSILGHTVTHGDRIDWSLDPVSGRSWNRGFSPDIPYRGPARLGDIKLAWELNKHQYFFTLGKASWLTGDPCYAREIIGQIDHWIDDNPFRRGVNWISALETGTRAVSWVMSFPFYAPHCDSRFLNKLVSSLAHHIFFVDQHLSFGRYTNTHLIGEAAALVVGGLFLDCPYSARWVKRGVEILESEIARQVHGDGVHVELSVTYHRFFLDHYFLVQALLAANGRSFSVATLSQMERMTEFLRDVAFPDGTAPTFGDSDDSRGFWFHAGCSKDFRSSLVIGAALFERGDFKAIAGGRSEDLFWLFGSRGMQIFNQLSAAFPEHTSKVYANSGYFILRGGWDSHDPVFVFDCGPLGLGPAGHGHADALSIQLYASGFPFLVDSGTFSYNIDYGWRDAFRSTPAHNTIVLDGLDQSVPGDRMSWIQPAAAKVRRWVSNRVFDLVEGEHNGYTRLPEPVMHRRTVIFVKPNVWCIWDCVEGVGNHNVEMLLHVRPDCEVVTNFSKGVATLGSPTGHPLHVFMSPDTERSVICDVLIGSDRERRAWYSETYGLREPSKALRARWQFSGCGTQLTCLSSSPIEVQMGRDIGKSLDLRVRDDMHREHSVFLRVGDGWPDGREEVCFDGEYLYRNEVGDGIQWVYASNFHNLSIEGLLEVQSQDIVESMAFGDGRFDLTMSPQHAANVKLSARTMASIWINGEPTMTGAKRLSGD